MQIEVIRNSDGTWDLLVDGRKYLHNESYQIVHNVAHELRCPLPEGTSECTEIANNIRKTHKETTMSNCPRPLGINDVRSKPRQTTVAVGMVPCGTVFYGRMAASATSEGCAQRQLYLKCQDGFVVLTTFKWSPTDSKAVHDYEPVNANLTVTGDC